jgi:hypothetical protein
MVFIKIANGDVANLLIAVIVVGWPGGRRTAPQPGSNHFKWPRITSIVIFVAMIRLLFARLARKNEPVSPY